MGSKEEVKAEIAEMREREEALRERVKVLEARVDEQSPESLMTQFKNLEMKLLKMVKEQDDQVDLLSAKISTAVRMKNDLRCSFNKLESEMNEKVSSIGHQRAETKFQTGHPLFSTMPVPKEVAPSPSEPAGLSTSKKFQPAVATSPIIKSKVLKLP